MQHALERIQASIRGDISTKKSDLTYYSTDGGVFEIMPSAIAFPKDVVDLQHIVRIANEELAHGDRLTLTARGNGTDQGGGPINTGLILDFTRYMDQILEVGEDYVVVQPGCRYGYLQTELRKHGRYLPPYPASVEVCTIGGAVANNSAGEKTVKYGATRDFVEGLQMIMADGSIAWIDGISYGQLEERKAEDSFIGSVYASIDSLLRQHHDIIHSNHPHVTKESAGYAAWKVREQHHFNLAQIIVGSQGTLGLITAIKLRTVPAPAPEQIVLSVSYYRDLESAGKAAQELHALAPSALEIVDKNLLTLVNKHKPELLEGLLPEELPQIVLLCEFDDDDKRQRLDKIYAAQDIYHRYAYDAVIKNDPEEQAKLWKLRRSAAAVMWTIPGKKKALPIIEDGTVPPHRLADFLKGAYEIFEHHKLEIAVWGHAGDADLHMQPFMDLSKISDRRKLFRVADDFYAMVQSLGGTAAGEHNDSLMRAPYRPLMFGEEMEAIFNKIKDIFDPENIFNPHKKVGVDFNYVKQHLRRSYTIESLARLNREEARRHIDR